eukprot:4237128-Prymnesium_polylepis.1
MHFNRCRKGREKRRPRVGGRRVLGDAAVAERARASRQAVVGIARIRVDLLADRLEAHKSGGWRDRRRYVALDLARSAW